MPQDEHESAENACPNIRPGRARAEMRVGADMGRLPILVRFGSKLVLEVLPSIAATVIGGYLLTQLHLGSSAKPETPAPQPAAAAPTSEQPTSEQPTAREDRAAMREVLKARRENPETPATVTPKPEANKPEAKAEAKAEVKTDAKA